MAYIAEDPAFVACLRSASCRVLQGTLTDVDATETSTYSYDAAGRLIQATIPRRTLTYAFASTPRRVVMATAPPSLM
jgi:YD repeat-containing protein